MSIIKQSIKRLFPEQALCYSAYKKLIKNCDSYLYTTGWMNSIREQKPRDMDGHPIPWMNFPVIKLLEERLTHDLNLFEYGSGYSTCFYANKVRAVTSVEYNEQWYYMVKSIVPENAQLVFKENDIDGDYCRAIKITGEQYDVVIIDGRDRVNCMVQRDRKSVV